MQLGFELDIYQIEELAGMYWYVSIMMVPLSCVAEVELDSNIREHRYLNHLAQTRLQHLERIRTFTTRRFYRLTNPTSEIKAAFKRSLSFLDFAMLEASATQSFADALACVCPPSPHYCQQTHHR